MCLGIGCAAGMVLVGGELCGIEYESQNCFLGVMQLLIVSRSNHKV